jgi:hypothetical protein
MTDYALREHVEKMNPAQIDFTLPIVEAMFDLICAIIGVNVPSKIREMFDRDSD